MVEAAELGGSRFKAEGEEMTKAPGPLERRSVMNGNIFNSKGVHVGIVMDDAIYGLKGQRLYDLKGSNIYKLNGDLVGHLPDTRGEQKRLDKAADKLFPEG
jgi:hypothetical protein